MTRRSENDPIAILAQDLLERAGQADAQRYLLGITGPPGAGKSTLSQMLHEELLDAHDLSSTVVPMDGFHLDNETLVSMGIRELKGIEKSFDGQGFVDLLKRLRETVNADVSFPTFDRSIECVVENGGVVPREQKLIIVEGNYLLSDNPPWHQIRCWLDEIWYVDVPEDVLLPRLLERHMQGGKNAEQARAKVESTDLPNARQVAATRNKAARVIRL
jgi:pantothenate kinase